MSKNILLSVVVTTFNRSNFLKKTIRSILNQTFNEFELIIVDDGSTDDTKIVVNSFKDKRINYIFTENWGGPARPRNVGTLSSRGKYIAFCDDDDIWTKNKLQISLDYLFRYKADLVYHDLKYINQNDKINLINRKMKSRDLKYPEKDDLLLNGNALNNSSVVLNKNKLLEINLISEDRGKISHEDYDTWIRLADIGCKFKRIPLALGYYRTGNIKLSDINNVIKNLNYIKYTHKKFYKDKLNGSNPWWMDFLISRMYFNNKDYKNALYQIKKVDISQTRIIKRLKIGIFFLVFSFMNKIILFKKVKIR